MEMTPVPLRRGSAKNMVACSSCRQGWNVVFSRSEDLLAFDLYNGLDCRPYVTIDFVIGRGRGKVKVKDSETRGKSARR
jgi:hypothetical protein